MAENDIDRVFGDGASDFMQNLNRQRQADEETVAADGTYSQGYLEYMQQVERQQKEDQAAVRDLSADLKEAYERSNAYQRYMQEQALAIRNMKRQLSVQEMVSQQIAQLNQQVNNMISSMLAPLTSFVPMLQPIPDKIRSTVDIQSASAGLYNNLNKLDSAMATVVSKAVESAEVPITLADFKKNPDAYPILKLDDMYCPTDITEEDCLSSGYVKATYQVKTSYIEDLKKTFLPIKERDIVEEQAEKLLEKVALPAIQALKPPLATATSIIPLDGVKEPVDSLIEAVMKVIEFAATRIPQKTLDEMIARRKASEEAAAARAQELMAQGLYYPDDTVFSMEKVANAIEDGTKTAMSYAKGAYKGAVDGFKNLKPPSLPPEVKELIDDFQDAIKQFCSNIQNVYIVVLFKLVGQIVKCLTDIAKKLGVPKLPDPLSRVPQLVYDAQTVMKFVCTLPASLVTLVMAIIKKKLKVIQLLITPEVPMPVQNIFPVPPGWDDVQGDQQMLQDLVDKVDETVNQKKDEIADLEKQQKELQEKEKAAKDEAELKKIQERSAQLMKKYKLTQEELESCMKLQNNPDLDKLFTKAAGSILGVYGETASNTASGMFGGDSTSVDSTKRVIDTGVFAATSMPELANIFTKTTAALPKLPEVEQTKGPTSIQQLQHHKKDKQSK